MTQHERTSAVADEFTGKNGIIRRRYRFTGRVQGVGFRYRAKHAAALYSITGWVKNEWDGSVLMEAQGTKFQLGLLLEAINRGTYIDIDWIQTEDIPVDEDETGFHVRMRDGLL